MAVKVADQAVITAYSRYIRSQDGTNQMKWQCPGKHSDDVACVDGRIRKTLSVWRIFPQQR